MSACATFLGLAPASVTGAGQAAAEVATGFAGATWLAVTGGRMAAIANRAVQKAHAAMTGNAGLSAAVAALTSEEGTALPPPVSTQVIAQAVTAELAERSAGVQYPAVYVYCTGLANTLREKFRTFSGKAFMTIEARTTHDRLEGLSKQSELYAAAVTQVLDGHRGDWGDGMFFAGAYEVEYGPVKRGGRNFTQTAKVTFELDVSL